ncbi:uncharacterized protein LOC133924537 isoform X2 [Phragmites australis]|uniref:uncharacterized protein LOC133924537 isoform X2 n=1 Tax=Phragmites australis TaxID=29695 RepID=UPI002D7845F5|nr:uncharacterized protein LOC133924537 isoform X2 [Phragmites australis]
MRARMEAEAERHEAAVECSLESPSLRRRLQPLDVPSGLILLGSPFRPQMEPKKSSAQHQPHHTEPKKYSPRGSGAAAAATTDAESPLSSLFYPPAHGANGKDQDLYSILYKGQSGSAQAGMTDGKPQWTPSKSRTAYTKDSEHLQTCDSVDTSCFGSSVHYGGRDYFYGSSTTKQATESSNDYKVDKKDPATDSHGDWWQGSFYY